MKIRYNSDEEIVKTIKEGLERTGGYCPCKLDRSEENKCMCQEFKGQIQDPDYEGYCHCRLYYKEK
mgnify:CR=1 FL=1